MLLVYGGSFNPPTLAHAEIASELMKKYKCELLFVPVGDNYGKSGLISFEHRYNMVDIIAKKINAQISDIENNEEYLGTYHLLKTFKRDDVYFIMGADNLMSLNEWFNVDELVAEFKFIIVTRDNIKIDFNEFKHPENFELYNTKLDVSSSLYRNEKCTHILDADVLKYIDDNKLYEE